MGLSRAPSGFIGSDADGCGHLPRAAQVRTAAGGHLVGLDAEAVAHDAAHPLRRGKQRSSVQSRKRVGTSGHPSSGNGSEYALLTSERRPPAPWMSTKVVMVRQTA